jgi:hypothetical protein
VLCGGKDRHDYTICLNDTGFPLYVRFKEAQAVQKRHGLAPTVSSDGLRSEITALSLAGRQDPPVQDGSSRAKGHPFC